MGARAVTVRLYIGDWVPFPHVATESVEDALTLLKGGHTVVVPTLEIARRVLARQGLPEDRIDFHVGV